MKTLQKGLQLILAVLALGFVTVAQAIPELQFDGGIDFKTASGALSISGVLTGSTDISPAPIIPGSFSLSNVNLSGVDTLTFPGVTVGQFIGGAGAELVINDSTPTSLLVADLVSLEMRGANGTPGPGVMTGVFSAISGSLLPDFDVSNLFSLVLNLSPGTNFETTMYNFDFTGQADGNLSAVPTPEPGILVLLSLGLGLISFQVRRRAA